MRKLLGGALALLTTGAVAQSGNTWSSLLSQGTDPASWPAGLEAIHMCHMPLASGNQYDPVAKTWSSALTMPGSEYRWYHSTAVLLPDGSVLSAGSNDEYNGRIFYPSYFGGTRPVVTAAPTSQISYNGTFELTLQSSGPSIEMVSLIRLNATTHGFDQGQRFIKCDYSQNGTTLTVTSPKNGAIAPPGWYMVFVVSTTEVPSHARYVKFG